MNLIRLKNLRLIVVALLMPLASQAQSDADTPVYLAVDCMKSTNADYLYVEKELWQPMHQALVDQGRRISWALYEVVYGDRSTCDFYTVTAMQGGEQLNATPDYRQAFAAAHPGGDFEAAMLRTLASRERVATSLWAQVDSTGIGKHRFVTVNYMKASDPDVYERMESRVFKPGHQALIDDGYRAGWGLYTQVSPLGTLIPHNYITLDFSTHLRPVPMAEAMMSANPDRDLDEMQSLLKLREQVLTQTWARVAATN